MRKFAIFLIVLSFLSLQACSFMHPIKMQQTRRYTLNPGALAIRKSQPTHQTLLVLPTESNQDIATSKMMYVSKPYELERFAYHRWAAQPAQMLTPLIAKALQQSGHYHAVVVAPFSGEADYRLNTHLYKLQQSFLTHPSRVQMSLSAQLIKNSTGKIVAEKSFTAVVKALLDNPYGGVVAANKATKIILQQLVHFCVANTKQMSG